MIEELSGHVTAGPQEPSESVFIWKHWLQSSVTNPEPLVPEQVHIFQYRDRISILLGGRPRPWLGRHSSKPVRCEKSI